MLILDTTVRLRIAYSVRKFPNFDDSLNQWNLVMISYCAYLYAFTAARLYSDPKVFLNIVEPNKSASVYNANIDHSVNETLGTLTPGILFGYTELIILVITCYFVLSWLFFNFCPSCDFCPKFYLSRYWKLDKQVMTKKLPSYYDILSEEQREALLIEEI